MDKKEISKKNFEMSEIAPPFRAAVLDSLSNSEEFDKKLEKELRFLKETYEADIITKEEYEKGKKRIEGKLNEPEEEIKIQEIPKEELEKKEIEDFAKELTNNHEEEKPAEEKIEKPIEELKKKTTEEKKEEQPEIIKKEQINIDKKSVLTALVLTALVFILVFFFAIKPTGEEATTPKFQPACMSDSDCQEEGKIGMCIEPNTKEAKCQFRNAVPVSLTVINGCVLCDTTKKINTLKQLFPGAKETIISHDSDEGKELITKLGIKSLPAFIFDQNITKTQNYGDIKNSFTKKGDKYVWSPLLSSNYYFKRSEMKNKLELYVMPETTRTIKTENNIQEVLDIFGDKIEFKKHLVKEEQKTTLEKELGITTYPAFLLNNQLKFSGILSAEMIKEKFCAVNKIEECSTALSTDIK